MFYAIGFPLTSDTVWYGLAEAAFDRGEASQVTYRDETLIVYRWDVGEGIEVVAVEDDPVEHRITALYPAFRARTISTVQFTRIDRDPEAPVGYLAFKLGELSLACFLSNLLTVPGLPRPNQPAALRVSGLAESIGLGWDPRAVGSLVSLQDQGQESDQAWYDFSGRIMHSEWITNPASSEELLWLQVAVQPGLELEVVTTKENVFGEAQPGAFAAGRCWLQGQLE